MECALAQMMESLCCPTPAVNPCSICPVGFNLEFTLNEDAYVVQIGGPTCLDLETYVEEDSVACTLPEAKEELVFTCCAPVTAPPTPSPMASIKTMSPIITFPTTSAPVVPGVTLSPVTDAPTPSVSMVGPMTDAPTSQASIVKPITPVPTPAGSIVEPPPTDTTDDDVVDGNMSYDSPLAKAFKSKSSKADLGAKSVKSVKSEKASRSSSKSGKANAHAKTVAVVGKASKKGKTSSDIAGKASKNGKASNALGLNALDRNSDHFSNGASSIERRSSMGVIVACGLMVWMLNGLYLR